MLNVAEVDAVVNRTILKVMLPMPGAAIMVDIMDRNGAVNTQEAAVMS